MRLLHSMVDPSEQVLSTYVYVSRATAHAHAKQDACVNHTHDLHMQHATPSESARTGSTARL